MALLMSLWLALGRGQDVEFVDRNLHWFATGSAISSLFLAGWMAGWLAGVRGWGPGFVHGATVWALLLVGTVAFGLPGALELFNLGATGFDDLARDPLWATFASIAGGLVVATIGGTIGGAARRPAWLYEPRDHRTQEPYGEARDIDLDRYPERERAATPPREAAEIPRTTPRGR